MILLPLIYQNHENRKIKFTTALDINILKRVGSGPEASALKTLALTYGYNYNVDKVIILVDGEPYKGSHMMYEANEAINTNVTNIKEYK